MALSDLMELAVERDRRKKGLSKERIDEVLPALRKMISFYREYPDLFVDDMKGLDNPFEFRPSQRVFLRAIMRHKYVYGVFPRGYSKSFIAVMALMLRAVLFPNSHLFVTTGGRLILI